MIRKQHTGYERKIMIIIVSKVKIGVPESLMSFALSEIDWIFPLFYFYHKLDLSAHVRSSVAIYITNIIDIVTVQIMSNIYGWNLLA